MWKGILTNPSSYIWGLGNVGIESQKGGIRTGDTLFKTMWKVVQTVKITFLKREQREGNKKKKTVRNAYV